MHFNHSDGTVQCESYVHWCTGTKCKTRLGWRASSDARSTRVYRGPVLVFKSQETVICRVWLFPSHVCGTLGDEKVCNAFQELVFSGRLRACTCQLSKRLPYVPNFSLLFSFDLLQFISHQENHQMQSASHYPQDMYCLSSTDVSAFPPKSHNERVIKHPKSIDHVDPMSDACLAGHVQSSRTSYVHPRARPG
ncbi:hypothetical protein PLICRDRAFT_282313 [Plicaturopsis crispa FD-325 SS-3]|nr:hypothetical protein PLICRDRAFT_282313 [Plicaturopsis crispa FD-325 SS-3]